MRVLMRSLGNQVILFKNMEIISTQIANRATVYCLGGRTMDDEYLDIIPNGECSYDELQYIITQIVRDGYYLG